MLYRVVKPIVQIALTWYYRSISVAGRSRVPASGPVFFAVNHPNALVDALVVASALPRTVRFTAKATIFANPVVAAFLRNAGVIPLRRVADELKSAAAREQETGTDRDVAASAIPSIVESKPGVAGVGASIIESHPAVGTGNAASPPVDPSRNANSFRAVSAALAEGSAVVIFPEGKSHDLPQLAPLRTGLARMATQARNAGVHGIQILPVGLLFERKEEPRSRVLIQIGNAIDVDEFSASVPDAGHAVEALTSLVAQRLAAVTLNFDTPEDAARITVVSETLAALLEPTNTVGHEGPSLSTVLSLVRRTVRVQSALASAEPDNELHQRANEYEQRIAAFRARLVQENIALSDIGIDLDATPGVRFAIRESLLALVLFPITWWGRLLHFIPIRVARWLALRGARNRDEPAMNTLLFGVVLVLASYAVETAIVWRLFGFWWALAFFATLIPSASSDLRYGDRVRRRAERMRTYFKFRKTPSLQRDLLAEADWLRREAGAIEQVVA